MSIKLKLLSPEGRLMETENIDAVLLPGSEGQIQILPGHAPMIGMLETGIFSYHKKSGETVYGALSAGFFEVKEDEVAMMVETFELQGKIDPDRAKKAQKKAESVLSQTQLEPEQFRKYELKLQRALIRQQAAAFSPKNK